MVYIDCKPRPKRIAKGNYVYHVLNRANGRLRIFKKPADFEAFEQILVEGVEIETCIHRGRPFGQTAWM